MKTSVIFQISILLAGGTGLAVDAGALYGQDRPTGSPPTTAPAAAAAPPGAQALTAKVEKVVGNVKWAPAEADAADPAVWQPVALGLDLPAGAQLKTSIRSEVIVRFGDETVALVESTSLVALMELYQTAQADRVRIGLGYGAVRAGSADKGKKSKLTIETPNAVLSKEGTQGIRMTYNRGNGNYEVSLSQSGLLKVTNTLTGRTLNVSPHEFLTQAMIRWIETEPYTRAPQISDAFALGANENLFSRQGGSSIFSTGGGATNGSNPVTISTNFELSNLGGLPQQINQQGVQTQNTSLAGNGLGVETGPGSVLVPGNTLINMITGTPTTPPSNVDLIIGYIEAHPELVTPYGVTVDQVVTYIRQNPQIVSNISVQDIINYVNTGELPSQFRAKRVQLAGNLKTRWVAPKTKLYGPLTQRPAMRPDRQGWSASWQNTQKVLKDKFFTMPANNPGVNAKPAR